jgi:riboflavin synthase
MFTGIIDHTGVIEKIEERGNTRVLTFTCQFADLIDGESISVDGACLTAIQTRPGGFACELSTETLSKTMAENYRAGTKVNLERALRLSDRLGGHLVMGHVDQTAEIKKRSETDGFVHFFLGGILAEGVRYLVPKGSIAVNGVSLTINACSLDGVELMIIPHTLSRTNLESLQGGSKVNVEFDWMVKVVLGEANRLHLLGRNTPLL